MGKLSTAAVAALTIGIVASGGTAQAAPAPEESSTGVPAGSIAAGVVRSNGKPVAGADVLAIAWPNDDTLNAVPEGGQWPLHTVGSATTDESGRFAINIAPTSLPSWVMDEGRVDLELQVADATRQLYFNYTVQVTASAGSDRGSRSRVWKAMATSSTKKGRSAPKLRFDLGRATAWDKHNDPATWLDNHGKPYGKAKRAKVARVAVTERSSRLDAVAARRDECYATVGPLIADRPEKFLHVYAWSGAKGSVTMTAGNEHTLGIGAKVDGGGWSNGGTQTKSFEGSAGYGAVVNSTVWNRVNMKDFGNTCSVMTYRKTVSYADLLSNDWSYVAHAYFDGYCATKPAGGWFATSNAQNKTYGQGFDIGPIQVSAQSGYNDRVDLKFTWPSQKTVICGTSSQGLATSAQVETHAP